MWTGGTHVVHRINPRDAGGRSNTRGSVAQQRQSITTNGDLRAIGHLGALDARAVQVGAVLTLEIDDDVAIVLEPQFRMGARHALLGIRQHDVAVAAAADLQPLLAEAARD